MANEYVRGQVIRLVTDPPFTKVDGTIADPTTVSVLVTDPAGTTTTYTYAGGQVVKDSTGAYHYDLATASVLDAQLGWWIYAWIGTGDPAPAEKNTFRLASEKVR